MKTLTKIKIVLSIIITLSLFAGASFSEVDRTGYDPTAVLKASSPVALNLDCSILYYKGEAEEEDYELDRLQAMGFNIIQCFDPTELDLEYLLEFNVLILFLVGPGQLVDQSPALVQFVSLGGSLFIHQPNSAGEVTYGPPGFEVNILDTWWCNFPSDPQENTACIVDPSHPLVSGFSNDDLGNTFDLVGDLGPGFSIISVNCSCGDPALAAGEYDSGLVVFDAGNYWDLSQPSDDFVLNLMDYLCTGQGSVSTQDETLEGVKAYYR